MKNLGEDCFDEPGLLLSGDAVLGWSALKPSMFLARILATGASLDLVALATEAGYRAQCLNPGVTDAIMHASIGTYREWMEELRPAVAIAWKRCRPLITRQM